MRTSIVVDPNTYDKQLAFEQAVELCHNFLDANSITRPSRLLTVPDRTLPGNNPWHAYGWSWVGAVYVNLKRSKRPVNVPGFSWSYTGFKSDLTAPGILAHEMGHHIKWTWEQLAASTKHRQKLRKAITCVRSVEPRVSSYEPNVDETWAEAMKLFILNPDLLREGRPLRYDLIRSIGIEPVNTKSWREVLANAHEKIITSAERWIASGKPDAV